MSCLSLPGPDIFRETTQAMTSQHRNVVWFSCGAASAVTAKIAVDTLPNVEIVYCNVLSDEHPDNQRFFNDVEEWIGREVTILSSEKYGSVNDVFAARRYMAGIAGAPCTVEMKKVPRFNYQRPDDVHLFGFTADEHRRIARFEENNPELLVKHLLKENNITKDDCLGIIEDAGIETPILYTLGYNNNNCLGCVKATGAKYWNMVRRDFPDVFELRSQQSRKYGVRLTRVRGERVFLDELPPDYLPPGPLEDISCGPDCSVDLTAIIAAEEDPYADR